MSAFCVFAVTPKTARIAANKQLPKLKNESLLELDARREVLADKLFARGEGRKVQVSPEFDAPQFASDWIAVANRSGTVTNCEVRMRVGKTDKQGAPSVRKGSDVQVLTWALLDKRVAA